MVNTCEPAQRPSRASKLKWLTSLSQKARRRVGGFNGATSWSTVLPGRQQVPNPAKTSEAERGNPVSSPARAGEPQGDLMGVRAWEVGRSERRPVMGRIRVSTLPGTKVSPRPTGASLRERVQIHLKRGRQIGDGGGSTTRLCTPSSGQPEPGGCKLVPQRLSREGSRIDYRSVFEVLEPCAGKLACTVLRGAGGP